MSCPVMGETIVLPPGTIPDSVFAKGKQSSKPEPERRKALEESIVPLTLAFSKTRDDATYAENLVVAYREFEGACKAAMRYAVRSGNVEGLCVLLQYDHSFNEFIDEDFMNELIEEGCKSNHWECVSVLMRYTRKGIKTVPEVEEVHNGEPERKTLGEGYGTLVANHAKLTCVFMMIYGLLLVANSKAGAAAVPSFLMPWIKLGGTRLPTTLPQVLAQALYLAVSVQAMMGFSGLGVFMEGPLALALVTLQTVLSVACTGQAVYTALGEAVWSQRASMRVVKVPKKIDVRELIPKKEDSAKDMKDKGATGDKKDKGAAAPHAMPFGHPTSGSGGKCPFASMWGGDQDSSAEGETEGTKKDK